MPITLPAWTPWRTRFPGGQWQNAPGKRTTPISAEALDNLETGVLGARQALSSVIAAQETETTALDVVEANYLKYERFATVSGLNYGSREGTDPLLSVKYGSAAGTAAQGNDARILKAANLPDSPAIGDVIAWDGAAWARIAKGSDGQVFVSQAGYSLPRWAANPGALPAASVKGTLAYYDGTTWSLLVPPSSATAENSVLRPDPLRTGLAWSFTVGGTEYIQKYSWTPTTTAQWTSTAGDVLRDLSRSVSTTSPAPSITGNANAQRITGKVILGVLPVGLRPAAATQQASYVTIQLYNSDNAAIGQTNASLYVGSNGEVYFNVPDPYNGYTNTKASVNAGTLTLGFTATQ